MFDSKKSIITTLKKQDKIKVTFKKFKKLIKINYFLKD